MKLNLLVIILVSILISACSLFQDESFTGAWRMNMGNDYSSETMNYVVNEDNSFSFDHTVTLEGRKLPLTYSGKISEDGELKGYIYYQGENVGQFNGNCNYENGQGQWSGGEYSGTWSAIKK